MTQNENHAESHDTCQLLERFLRNELDCDVNARFELHLAECHECARQVDLASNLNDWLFVGNARIDVPDSLVRAVEAARVTPATMVNRRAVVASLAIAALILFVIGLRVVRPDRDARAPIARIDHSDAPETSVQASAMASSGDVITLTAGEGFLVVPQSDDESDFVIFWVLPSLGHQAKSEPDDGEGSLLTPATGQPITEHSNPPTSAFET